MQTMLDDIGLPSDQCFLNDFLKLHFESVVTEGFLQLFKIDASNSTETTNCDIDALSYRWKEDFLAVVYTDNGNMICRGLGFHLLQEIIHATFIKVNVAKNDIGKRLQCLKCLIEGHTYYQIIC